MNTKWLLAAALAIAIQGCAKMHGDHSDTNHDRNMSRAAEENEPGETKISLDQAPPAVKQTIQRELVGAQLEDIAMKERNGKTIYETDIIKNGQKWELIVGEDGNVISNKRKGGNAEEKSEAQEAGWRQKFDVEKEDLMPTGSNSYLAIQPGKILKLRSGIDSLTVSILPETKTVDGVKVGILEERETKDGKLIEVSRNYFATDRETNDVYYFGEDVDNYKDGKIISHESAWHAGENGARFGLMIPGRPKVGDKFYQEIAPKVAMDRVEIVSTDETVTTPAGTFRHCVHLKETTPIESDVSHKYYAPGVGMIKDDEFELTERP